MIQQEQGLKGHQNTLNLNSISYLGLLLHKASQNHTVSIHSQELCVCVSVCEAVKMLGSISIKERMARKQAHA